MRALRLQEQREQHPCKWREHRQHDAEDVGSQGVSTLGSWPAQRILK